MAINTYRFWMATDSNRLLANQTSFIQANAPAFYQGNVANLELHMVASAGVGVTPIEIPFPAGAEISVAVGDTNAYPTGGSWELSVDGVETDPMPYNATTAQVAAALNALASVSAAGGVSVSKTGEGYTITWNTYGLKPTIGIGSDTLTPSSYESISLVQTGSTEHRQIVFVELRQNPIALSTIWTPLPQPSITTSLVKAWDGSSVIWRVTIYPQPKAGTMTLSYGTKTATIDVASSSTTIAIALEAQVFATGQYQWDIALAEDSTLAASGNLIGYNGYSGTINFATAECHQFLAGDESKNTTLEVSMSVDDKRYTILQTGCQVFADVISDGVLTPLPLGVALSEQVANARFVRRDIDQNPDATTQDVIWQNLGVDTLGSDVTGALNGADSPSAANPFATISDIPTVTQAEWGNIIGDINSQTDLAVILNGLDVQKYDVSNPAGYIDGSYLNGYATESWVIDQNYLTSSASGIQFDNGVKFLGMDGLAPINIGSVFLQPGGTLSNGDMWFNSADGRLGYYYAQQSGSGVRYVATITDLSNYYQSSNPSGFITASALVPYALKDSPTFSGTAKFVNPGNYAVVLDDPSTPGYSNSLSYQSIAIQQPGGETASMGLQGFRRQSGPSYAGELNATSVTIYNPSGTISMDYAYGVRKDGAELYARKAGDTFTGKVNFTPLIGIAGINIGIGGTSTGSTTPGDLWITTGGANLNFRDGTGAWKVLASLSNGNVFTAVQTVNVNSTSTALRVTQLGTGRALVVEDGSTQNPDQDATVIDNNGSVGIGVNSATWTATSKLEVVGNVMADTFSNGSGPTFAVTATDAHASGADILDLLVTINGTSYRIGLRPA